MESISSIEVYRALKDRLGEDEAQLLLRYIDTTLREQVATKADLELARTNLEHQIKELSQHIDEVEARLNQRIDEVEARLNQRIDEVEVRLNQRIENVRTELLQRLEVVQITLERRLDSEGMRIDRRIDQLDWKLRLYFVILGLLILVTNPTVLETIGKLFGAFVR